MLASSPFKLWDSNNVHSEPFRPVQVVTESFGSLYLTPRGIQRQQTLLGVDLKQLNIQLSPELEEIIQNSRSVFTLSVLIHHLVEESIVFMSCAFGGGQAKDVRKDDRVTYQLLAADEFNDLKQQLLLRPTEELRARMLNHCIGCLTLGCSLNPNPGSSMYNTAATPTPVDQDNEAGKVDRINGYLASILASRDIHITFEGIDMEDPCGQTKHLIDLLVTNLDVSEQRFSKLNKSTSRDVMQKSMSKPMDYPMSICEYEPDHDAFDTPSSHSSSASSTSEVDTIITDQTSPIISNARNEITKGRNHTSIRTTAGYRGNDTLSSFQKLQRMLSTTQRQLDNREILTKDLQKTIKELKYQYLFLQRQYDDERSSFKKSVSEWKTKCDKMENELFEAIDNLENMTQQTIDSEIEISKLNSIIDKTNDELTESKSTLLNYKLEHMGQQEHNEGSYYASGGWLSSRPTTPGSALSNHSDESSKSPFSSSSSQMLSPGGTSVTILRHEFRKMVTDLNRKHNKELSKEQHERRRLEEVIKSYKSSIPLSNYNDGKTNQFQLQEIQFKPRLFHTSSNNSRRE